MPPTGTWDLSEPDVASGMITLLTDFGLSDPYVGIMKGVILSINPEVRIVDITHEVDPQDVSSAAYLIAAAYRYFPKKSIHVVVVDPGVGGSRAVIAVTAGGHFFLAPNNGVLSLILDAEPADAVVRVDNPDFFLQPVSRTFHGRDIFAPVAAHLSRGLNVSVLGNRMESQDLVDLGIVPPVLSNTGELRGRIVLIDRFGNLITNIHENSVKQLCGTITPSRLKVIIGEHQINGLADRYSSVPSQTLLAIFGSMGFLEISVNRGSAAAVCPARKGDPVFVIAG